MFITISVIQTNTLVELLCTFALLWLWLKHGGKKKKYIFELHDIYHCLFYIQAVTQKNANNEKICQ
jgi:hypothetical protein